MNRWARVVLIWLEHGFGWHEWGPIEENVLGLHRKCIICRRFLWLETDQAASSRLGERVRRLGPRTQVVEEK